MKTQIHLSDVVIFFFFLVFIVLITYLLSDTDDPRLVDVYDNQCDV